MKILFVSNFYPPARPGGYTQWCHEVAQALGDRGHTIRVLTSRHEREKADELEAGVYRDLHLEADPIRYSIADFFSGHMRRQSENARVIDRVLARVQPDLVFVWGMWLMSRLVPAQLEDRMGDRVVYYLSDYWPIQPSPHREYWSRPSNRWMTRFPKRFLGAIANLILNLSEDPELRFKNTICVSRAVRNILARKDIPVENAVVIHGGTDLTRFQSVLNTNGRIASSQRLRLLYAGQIVPHKGVHTAIEAADHLFNGSGVHEFELTIVGGGSREYINELSAMISERGLNEVVSLKGEVPKEEMPAVLAQSDVLIFPSVYEEPFARMTQEGMVAGLAVIGTSTGGTPEILQHDETGLTFPPNDFQGLAAQIERLIDDRELCARLARNGRAMVVERFTLNQMVDQIEDYLLAIASQGATDHPGWEI